VKKTIALFLCFAMVLCGMAACGLKKKDGGTPVVSDVDTSSISSTESGVEESSAEESSIEESSDEPATDSALYGTWYATKDGKMGSFEFRADNTVIIALDGKETQGSYSAQNGVLSITAENKEIVLSYSVEGEKLILGKDGDDSLAFSKTIPQKNEFVGCWGTVVGDKPEIIYMSEDGEISYKYNGTIFPTTYKIEDNKLNVEIKSATGIVKQQFTKGNGVIVTKQGIEFYYLTPVKELLGQWNGEGNAKSHYLRFDDMGIATFFKGEISYYMYTKEGNDLKLIYKDADSGKTTTAVMPYGISGNTVSFSDGCEMFNYTKAKTDSALYGKWTSSENIDITFYSGGVGVFCTGGYGIDMIYTAANGAMEMSLIANDKEENHKCTYKLQNGKLLLTIAGDVLELSLQADNL